MDRVICIYAAYPIDQAQRTMVGSLAGHAILNGVSVFWPDRGFSLHGGVPNQAINRVNEAALDACDGLVAYLPRGVPTLGVPVEIERALIRGKPVGLIGEHMTVQVSNWVERGAIWSPDPETVLMGVVDLCRLENSPKEAKEGNLLVQVLPEANGTPVVPTQAYEGDAGYDLYVATDTFIAPGQWYDVPMGIRVQAPPGIWAMIIGRSSAWRRKRIDVRTSVIDQGYRGPIFAACQNLGDMPVTLTAGERVAQLIPMPLTAQQLAVLQVDELDSSHRGQQGFGSSGE